MFVGCKLVCVAIYYYINIKLALKLEIEVKDFKPSIHVCKKTLNLKPQRSDSFLNHNQGISCWNIYCMILFHSLSTFQKKKNTLKAFNFFHSHWLTPLRPSSKANLFLLNTIRDCNSRNSKSRWTCFDKVIYIL